EIRAEHADLLSVTDRRTEPREQPCGELPDRVAGAGGVTTKKFAADQSNRGGVLLHQPRLSGEDRLDRKLGIVLIVQRRRSHRDDALDEAVEYCAIQPVLVLVVVVEEGGVAGGGRRDVLDGRRRVSLVGK